jgi:phosphonatase-like hydrolase
MLPELVVFDMAGTTVHDEDFVNFAVIKGFADNGFDCSLAMINPLMGITKPVAIGMVLREAGDSRADDAAFIDQVHESFLRAMVEFYETSDNVREVDGAAECFSWLHERGIKVALDTGFSRPIADVILRRLGWGSDQLDFTICSDEVANGRPAPDMIFEAMKHVGVESAAMVAKVGDTPSDIGQGVAAGCGWVVGVWEGTHTREQLLASGATHVCANVSRLANDIFGSPK